MDKDLLPMLQKSLYLYVVEEIAYLFKRIEA